MKSRKNKIIIGMCIVVLLMATGYALLSAKLNIKGIGNIVASWEIKITKIESVAKGRAYNISEPTYTDTTMTFEVGVKEPGDKMTFNVTIKNEGSIDAILSEIDATASGNEEIVYSITGIQKESRLKAGQSITFQVSTEFDINATSLPSNPSKELTIDLTYIQDDGQTLNPSDPEIDEDIITNQSICTIASDSTVEAGLEGAKYDCKVDPNKDAYTFYLIDNNEDGTSDLIMNANINASGEAVIPGVTEDTGTVEWDDSEYNTTGPIISMTYLYNATKSWTNVEPLNYTYYDRQTQNSGWGYQSFISTNGIALITAGDGVTTNTIGTEVEPLRARMPIYTFNEAKDYLNEITNEAFSNFLYNNIDINWVYEPYGYWLMSTSPDDIGLVFFIELDTIGSYGAFPNTEGYYGVRPVITVKL